MAEYLIAEDGDPDIGFSWDIYRKDGDKGTRVASFYDEKQAIRFLAAIQWYDTFETGVLSLPPKTRPKKQNASIRKKSPQKK
mgnify:FL=1